MIYPTPVGYWADAQDRVGKHLHTLVVNDRGDYRLHLCLLINNKERAWLGRVCPAGVTSATWEARLAVQRDNSDRVLLGWCCPAGVPGATWEARLAVQRYDEDRG